ncbi:MAG: hypothetical protein ACTHV1_07990 [Flaviflexus sp.]|uniref:hypothetical protein n=1 Tax=Flaviflexus sp. TaxID=1969482 RepID=UPI003F931B68
MTYIYPRLRKADAEVQFQLLNEEYLREGKISYTADFRHPKAYAPSVSGEIVPNWRLRDTHDKLEELLPKKKTLSDSEKRQFDVQAGKILLSVLEEDGQAQASDKDMWPYLSLVVFPDIATRRFAAQGQVGLTADRFLAGRRNVFYVAYLRAWILGDLILDDDSELLEDELVGLVDREFSTDHRLARSLVRAIASQSSSENRRDMVRKAYKAIRFKQKITDFAALSDDALDALVKRVMYESL